MKELIRKILRESNEAPEWFQEWKNLSTDERINSIEKRKKDIIKLIPKMIKFFKVKYGDSLHKIEVVEKGVHYGSEVYSTQVPLMIFYFDEGNIGTKREIAGYLINLFNINLGYYAVPFEFEVYVKKWERI